MLIDTHCHLNFKAFKKDLDKVIKRAQEAGVKKIIVPGTDLVSSKRAVEIAEEFEEIMAVVGFHPHHVKGIENIDEELKQIEKSLRELAKNKKVVGIGECGLDYYVYQQTKYKNTEITPKQKIDQKRLFGLQIQLAKELKLPLVIHNREADMDILDTINHFSKIDNKTPDGVLHCISGPEEYLKKGLEMGFYVGIDGNVTYDKRVEKLVTMVPTDRILLETDSPCLTPEPVRSEAKNRGDRLRNEPISVRIVAEFVARLKNISLDKIEASSTKNAEALFSL